MTTNPVVNWFNNLWNSHEESVQQHQEEEERVSQRPTTPSEDYDLRRIETKAVFDFKNVQQREESFQSDGMERGLSWGEESVEDDQKSYRRNQIMVQMEEAFIRDRRDTVESLEGGED